MCYPRTIDAIFDQINKFIRKTKFFKNNEEKGVLYPLKCVTHIHFYKESLLFFYFTCIYCFLEYKDIVNDLSILQKSFLDFRYKIVDERFEAITEDFGQDLVGGIAKGDWYETDKGEIFIFWDDGETSWCSPNFYLI